MSDVIAVPSARTPHRPRVLVVDADKRVRAGLACLLDLSGVVEVVGEASHPGEAIGAVERTAPDVVVLDPRLPEIDGGAALVSIIRHRCPQARVLLLSWSSTPIDGALGVAADGYLPKSLAPQELVDRVAELAQAPADGGTGG